ncbi:hypothetical protein [Actinosynnema mirum]|uniref:Protein serine/threonine phosphatase n=1 Tax=Actinosynnema mirum (strain ATCC 29888 / DSM 43827 / JCM 3225 / NBRC 14064 / NCIMB 13271 / NRRL B-12336 / IMRU 3971 / 101) TaxID=446462 RepID=C6WBB5_ACTMD|nr:hypothetical protein [Actinosynnema mirum]ACU39406.1 hypothetical protein Amir_5588 [Actinosynnema mirum DSM 43827]
MKITYGTALAEGKAGPLADAVHVEVTPLGAGAALVDGIGHSAAVVRTAQRAAEVAAIVAAHRDAQAGLLAAADTVPAYPGSPNATAAVVSVGLDGRVEVATAGQVAAHAWYPERGELLRLTPAQVVGQWVRHALAGSTITATSRAALEALPVMTALDSYVLLGLAHASVSTIAWTALRGQDASPAALVLTSNGVRLGGAELEKRGTQLGGEPQALAEELVAAGQAAPLDDPDRAVDDAAAVVLAITYGEDS